MEAASAAVVVVAEVAVVAALVALEVVEEEVAVLVSDTSPTVLRQMELLQDLEEVVVEDLVVEASEAAVVSSNHDLFSRKSICIFIK